MLFDKEYNIKKHSKEFCFGDCEGIQFITSVHRINDRLHLFYGVNDCNSKILNITVSALNKTFVNI